jgi:hypothetical protein
MIWLYYINPYWHRRAYLRALHRHQRWFGNPHVRYVHWVYYGY